MTRLKVSRTLRSTQLFVSAFVLLFIVAAVGLHAIHAQTNPERISGKWPARAQPPWFNSGIVMVGTWEPLQWLYRKNWQNWGNTLHGKEAEAVFREERSEKTVVGLKEMGVNLVLSSFHKGFGIENEKASMDDAREYGMILHKHGLKMGVLVDNLLLPEEIYTEFPDARHWHRILYDGKPDVYDNDGYRYRPFLNHPGYIAYMKQVIKQAVDSGADWIHFDIVNQTPENFHPLAQHMFREWLKKQYPTPDGWFFRSGLHYWDYVLIPHYTDLQAVDTFDQPIAQEYIIFKCKLLGDWAAEMSSYIRSLNPNIAVDWVTQGITGANRIVLNDMDFPRVLPWLDSYWSEDADIPGYRDDGRLISKIRSYKLGQQYNDTMIAYTGPSPAVEDKALDASESDPRLSMAEAMAFNRQCLGDVGEPLSYKTFPEAGRRYINFFRKDFDLLAKAPTAADVAVLRGFASLAYNNYETHREVGLAEQTLIQAQVPFDAIDDHNLADLSKYKVLVLADQDSMADSQIAAVREHVRRGGGLVVTANTARYDDWRRDRSVSGLSAVLGFDGKPATATPGVVRHHQFGSGRVAYLPELTPSIPIPKHAPFTSKYWAPAANGKQFIEAIRWAGGNAWEITAPPYVAVEAYSQTDKNRYILHLLNYNFRRQADVRNVTVAVQTPDASSIRKITAYSPDQSASVDVPVNRTTAGVSFTVPEFNVYTLLAIQK